MTDPTAGAGQTAWPPSPYQIQVSYGGGGVARGSGADWFGPLDPLRPIAPPDVAGRRFDFPPGYNLSIRPRAYEPIGFAELRAFADAYDLLRLVIETRKDQMERQRWRIRARAGKLKRVGDTPDADTQARAAALEGFFHKPDGVTRWKTWLRSLLEDMFVIDAATLYCQRTRNGALCALQQLDGSTIKRVIDDWGRTPQPFVGSDGAIVCPPAYQQVLKGLPAVDYATRDIIYRPRNVRAHKVYGYSPVQQVLMTVNIALRRQMWQLDYYTEGSIPDALIGVPNSWTPDQIRQFQDYWDTEFVGDLARRRKAKFVPGDTAAKVVQTKEPDLKDDFDEWLARIVCFAFSIPPQWAVKAMNRATADNQSAQSEEEGLEPTKAWVKELIDEIIAEEFSSPDLELHWLDEDDGDPETVLADRVRLGAITLNEMRSALGLDPYVNAAADRPMTLTATGYVPIEANADGDAASPANLTRGSMPFCRPMDRPVERGGGVPLEKYNPDQPRVSAGSPDGGQWTNESAPGATASQVASRDAKTPKPQYASTLVIKHPRAWTGNSRIDKTTDKLVTVLAGVTETIEYPPDMSAQRFGQLVHQAFATAVVAEGIPGIGPNDVETTFPDGPYGSPGSIRTDVVLRDDDGNIIAIYDVKTGEADLTPARASQLRSMTGAPSNTPVIQLRFNEALSKASSVFPLNNLLRRSDRLGNEEP